MRLIPPQYVEPFLESGNRRHLKMGMEFVVFLFALWAPFVTVFAVPTKWGILLAGSLFLLISQVGRYAARKDPYLTEVYRDALEYTKQPYYTALPRTRPAVLTIAARSKPKTKAGGGRIAC